MEVEELLRSHPVDGVVILAGCDKTTPGTLMGAISMDIPTLLCPAGTMMSDRYLGAGKPAQVVGAGTHTRMFWDEYQAGRICDEEWVTLESHMTRSPGTCNVMGTASTMTLMVEAMGLSLPGAASLLAMDAAHVRMATDCGQRIVSMIWEDLRPSQMLTRGSFLNAVAVQMALGGSTNAAVHILAPVSRYPWLIWMNGAGRCRWWPICFPAAIA
jgi:dihydroxy-acid dehydratase